MGYYQRHASLPHLQRVLQWSAAVQTLPNVVKECCINLQHSLPCKEVETVSNPPSLRQSHAFFRPLQTHATLGSLLAPVHLLFKVSKYCTVSCSKANASLMARQPCGYCQLQEINWKILFLDITNLLHNLCIYCFKSASYECISKTARQVHIWMGYVSVTLSSYLFCYNRQDRNTLNMLHGCFF